MSSCDRCLCLGAFGYISGTWLLWFAALILVRVWCFKCAPSPPRVRPALSPHQCFAYRLRPALGHLLVSSHRGLAFRQSILCPVQPATPTSTRISTILQLTPQFAGELRTPSRILRVTPLSSLPPLLLQSPVVRHFGVPTVGANLKPSRTRLITFVI